MSPAVPTGDDFEQLHHVLPRFYWCWNANSGDTGGLAQDDWSTLHWRKLAFLTTFGLRPWFMDWVRCFRMVLSA